jgi:hypothetical protein
VNPGSLGHPQHYQGGEADLLGIAASGDRLVAVGYLARDVIADAWYSGDALRWTRVVDFPATAGSLATAVTGGTPGFVAVGTSGKRAAAWLSRDGMAWRAIDAGEAFVAQPEAHMTTVVPRHDGFIAAGYTGSIVGPISAAFWASRDGVAWTRATTIDGSADARVNSLAIAGGGGAIVAVGRTGDAQKGTGPAAWVSRDGGTWTRATGLEADGAQMMGVAAGDTGFVAVGVDASSTHGIAWTSRDGTSWTRAPDAAAFENYGLKIEVRAITWDGSQYVAAGHRLFGTQFGTAVVWTSPDGAAWTRANDVPSFSQGKVQAIARGGPGLIAGGNFGAPDFSVPTVWISPAR